MTALSCKPSLEAWGVFLDLSKAFDKVPSAFYFKSSLEVWHDFLDLFKTFYEVRFDGFIYKVNKLGT